MAQLNFYVADDIDSSVIRQKLNDIAAELGFMARSGPTTGGGNAAAMLLAIAQGGLKVMPVYEVHIPKVGWDQDDHSALVEQRIDDDTLLSVDIIEPEPEVFHVRHAVVVRYDDNTEVRNVSPREIQLVWDR